MNYNQSCAAKGNAYPNSRRESLKRSPSFRSEQRAAVNIFKTENSFEMLVFAPGRVKENFHLQVNGDQLTVSYTPPEGFPHHNWVLREYSRGGFTRSFSLHEGIDTANISAKYTAGVLQVSLPVIEGMEMRKKEIVIN